MKYTMFGFVPLNGSG